MSYSIRHVANSLLCNVQVIHLSYPPWFVRNAWVISLWCGWPEITVGRPRIDPLCEHKGAACWAGGKGTAKPPALSLTATPHCSRAGHRKIFLYHNMWHLWCRQLQEESSIPGSRCKLFQSPPSQHKIQFQETLSYSGKMSWMHCNQLRPLEIFVIIYQLKLKLNSWFKHEHWSCLQGKPSLNPANQFCKLSIHKVPPLQVGTWNIFTWII